MIRKSFYRSFLVLFLLLFLAACGAKKSETGSITVSLRLPSQSNKVVAAVVYTNNTSALAAPDLCSDLGGNPQLKFKLLDSLGNVVNANSLGVTSYADCNSHSASLGNIPPGTYTLKIEMEIWGNYSAYGEKYVAEVRNLNIAAGQTTNAGTVTLAFTEALAHPTVEVDNIRYMYPQFYDPTGFALYVRSPGSYISNTTNIPITSTFTTSFTQNVKPSTITSGTVKLTDASGNRIPLNFIAYRNDLILLSPLSNLAYSTQYTLSILEVKDMSGAAIAPFTCTFTTEAPPLLAPIGDVTLYSDGLYNQFTPAGKKCLTWNIVNGATGYNLYYGSSNTVTPANGTKIANVRTPYFATVAGYYVVTAFNQFGEGPASAAVSIVPN